MSRVYGVRIDVAESGGRPQRFTWQGRVYTVRRIIDHWVTLRADWAMAAGGAAGLPQRLHWRVEAGSESALGVYELVNDAFADEWSLARILD
ncbi:hypothetical protein GCM10027440_53460 [Nocardiopsis coralliicola]